MTGEEWTRYLAGLPAELQALAANIMRRISRLLNKERISVLDEIQRIERKQDMTRDRTAQVEGFQLRYVAQQDRLEERTDMLEVKVEALAAALAALQADRGPDGHA